MKSTHNWYTELTAKLEALIETCAGAFELSALATMVASEDILRREWDSEEEDYAWAHL